MSDQHVAELELEKPKVEKKAEILKYLKYLVAKREHYEKNYNRDGVKAVNVMLDVYLDIYNRKDV